MAEYIERDALIEAVRQYQYPYGVEFLICNQPAADVAPVVHGRWVPYHEADIGWDEYGVRCSVCNFEVESLNIGLVCQHYCPNCGARMDGE